MHTQAHPRPLMDVRAAAWRVNVSPKTIRRRIASGELPAVKVGGVVRIDADDLEQFLVDRLIASGAARR